jgi:hypothetical protein
MVHQWNYTDWRKIKVLSYGKAIFLVMKSLKCNTCPIFQAFPIRKGGPLYDLCSTKFLAIDECLLLEATLTCFQPSKVNTLINMKCGEKLKLY